MEFVKTHLDLDKHLLMEAMRRGGHGTKQTAVKAALAEFVNRLAAFPLPPELDADDYRRAARLYRACRVRGSTPRSTIDCINTQTCLKSDLPIQARNRDYQAIAQIAPLRIVAAP